MAEHFSYSSASPYRSQTRHPARGDGEPGGIYGYGDLADGQVRDLWTFLQVISSLAATDSKPNDEYGHHHQCPSRLRPSRRRRPQASPRPPRLRGPPAVIRNEPFTRERHYSDGMRSSRPRHEPGPLYRRRRLDYRGPAPVSKTAFSQPDLDNLQRKGGNTSATISTARNSVIKASRMPALPQDDIKIVIRIRGGINIAKVGQLMVTKAICMAACIESNARSEDTICPNLKQNILVVSTLCEANAAKYLRISNISIGEQTFETTAYKTAPHETCKGFIRGVPLDETQDSINRKIFNPHNPLALAAKRIKETGTAIIAFDRFRVPNYVTYDNAMVKCSLYRKQIAMRHVCGRLSHRAAYAPRPTTPFAKDVDWLTLTQTMCAPR
ncbi:hypothetical protein HPB49_008659 [Dermacentor silvarum]|uniref:Uncharacterized protein n=1 Tax=Dermacentor silvarum TaxID=543639 RepID=A0ACB8CK87_DERSI|nr:hypothetical protein HPB49_008659 [Dermacentor silvarum]